MNICGIFLIGFLSASGLFASTFSLPFFTQNKQAEVSYAGRNYWRGETKEEVKALRYIVTSLGNVPILKLPRIEPELNSAGEKIDTLHPLNSWRIIFTDNEMISSMHNIRTRRMVWKRFVKQMGESLELSYNHGEVSDEHINDFANRVGVDFSLIAPHIKAKRWESFVKDLLVHVKRNDNSDRYSM